MPPDRFELSAFALQVQRSTPDYSGVSKCKYPFWTGTVRYRGAVSDLVLISLYNL